MASYTDNGGVSRNTAHTCARRQRAKRTAQTVFGERSEFWEKKFDERSERLAVFFFLPNWEKFFSEMSQISSRGGDGEFAPVSLLKKQSEMPENIVCVSCQ